MDVPQEHYRLLFYQFACSHFHISAFPEFSHFQDFHISHFCISRVPASVVVQHATYYIPRNPRGTLLPVYYVSPYQSTTCSNQFPNTTLLYYYTTTLLQYYTTALLNYYTTILLHYHTITPHYHTPELSY